jgi:hypothetical protein
MPSRWVGPETGSKRLGTEWRRRRRRQNPCRRKNDHQVDGNSVNGNKAGCDNISSEGRATGRRRRRGGNEGGGDATSAQPGRSKRCQQRPTPMAQSGIACEEDNFGEFFFGKYPIENANKNHLLLARATLQPMPRWAQSAASRPQLRL